MSTSALLLLSLGSADAYNLAALARGWSHAAPAAARVPAVLLQMEGEVKIVSDETYGLMMKALMETENPLEQEVSANYMMVDYAFLQKLDKAENDPKPEIAKRATEIKEVINQEMGKRMQAAVETLKDIFTSPTAIIMDGKIAGLARAGKIDTALSDLLQANLEQARAAGEAGAGAVAMLEKLQTRVRDELDTKLDPPVALIRRLMRMESPEARQRLLREKMAPKVVSQIVIAGVGGEEEKPESNEPEVPPRVMAQTIQELKYRFGNVDDNFDSGFVKRLDGIADEAEAVALELAGGNELSAKQAQDLAWEKQTVSVWALEQVEEEAHQDGNWAMWEKEAQEQMARNDGADRLAGLEKDMGGM